MFFYTDYNPATDTRSVLSYDEEKHGMTKKQIKRFYDDCPSGYCVEETRVFDVDSLRYITVEMQYIELF